MANSSDGFGVYFHHGGSIVKIDGERHYVGGTLVPRHGFRVCKFGYFDIETEIMGLGYVSWTAIYGRFPFWGNSDFKKIEGDKDVTEMLQWLDENCRVFHLYVDGGELYGNLHEGQKGVNASGEGDVEHVEDEEDEEQVLQAEEDEEQVLQAEEQVLQAEDVDSEEDDDYIPDENEDYTDDELADDELCSDEEYIEARRNLRDTSNKGICDEVFESVGNEPVVSDYEDSDGDVHSSETDEDCDNTRRKEKRPVHDPKSDPKGLVLVIGMRFADGFEARDAIRASAIQDGRQIHFKRVSKTKMQAYCTKPCEWRVYGSLVASTGHFIIKTLVQPHTCTLAMRNSQASAAWIAKQYLNVFRYRPEISTKELASDMMARFNLHVSRWKLYNARDKAIEMLRGTVEEHYAKLRSYILELKRVDIEGTFVLRLAEGAIFQGIYICFSALRKGFQAGCRRVIGLDGAHLKTYLGGVLLCAVATDANKEMFPIAWAIVEVENQDNWGWFMSVLMEDLSLGSGAGITFISDQQKGLLNAVHNWAPHATHRNCARHVFMNWKKSHKGVTLKNLFWRAVRATYLAEYNQILEEMLRENKAAHDDFIGRDVTKFCKVFIDPSSLSDMILNNISETFNGYILQARGKHVIDMLEEIRTSLMERQHRKRSDLVKHTHRICPQILDKLEHIKSFSRYCIPHPSSDVMFEVENFGDRFIVDLRLRTCTCRAWDITGIPCIHACSAVHFLRRDAADFVHDCYSVATYNLTYLHSIPPVNGMKMWPGAQGDPVVPPKAKKMPGRPKKERIRDPCEENPQNPSKLRKTGVQMTCQKCFQKGHNQKGCKNEAVVRAPKPKGKPGRPRKAPPLDDTTRIIANTSKPKMGRPKKTQTATTEVNPTTAPNTSSVSKASSAANKGSVSNSTVSGTMGGAGRIFGKVPAEKRPIFLPTRPRQQPKGKSNAKNTPTQESQT